MNQQQWFINSHGALLLVNSKKDLTVIEITLQIDSPAGENEAELFSLLVTHIYPEPLYLRNPSGSDRSLGSAAITYLESKRRAY